MGRQSTHQRWTVKDMWDKQDNKAAPYGAAGSKGSAG